MRRIIVLFEWNTCINIKQQITRRRHLVTNTVLPNKSDQGPIIDRSLVY